MSHELRTPLTAIKGFADNMRDGIGGALNDRQGRYLSRILSNTSHLMTVINDILDLSRIEAGRLDIESAPFEVKKLIASCCETVGPMLKRDVTLSYEVAGDVGEAHTDEARLRQIVINLLSNAVKFTESGEVHVACCMSGPLPGLLSQATPLPYTGEGRRGEGLSPSEISSKDKILEIAVSDTGIGIPPDALGYIFEEFRQVEGSHQKQKGTGLGLSITKRLTELLGGTICVESEVGKGSVFTVQIPKVYRK
jgi:two-component system sensor histidine kinase/response regulator